jgi:hypothetical protein
MMRYAEKKIKEGVKERIVLAGFESTPFGAFNCGMRSGRY